MMEEQEKTFKESTLSFARNVIVFSTGGLHLTLPWMNQALASCILTCLLPNSLPFKAVCVVYKDSAFVEQTCL